MRHPPVLTARNRARTRAALPPSPLQVQFGGTVRDRGVGENPRSCRPPARDVRGPAQPIPCVQSILMAAADATALTGRRRSRLQRTPGIFAVVGIHVSLGVLIYWCRMDLWSVAAQRNVIWYNPAPSSPKEA